MSSQIRADRLVAHSVRMICKASQRFGRPVENDDEPASMIWTAFQTARSATTSHGEQHLRSSAFPQMFRLQTFDFKP